MFRLEGLYPITDRRLARLESPGIVAALLAGGARLIQLRIKEASARELLDEARVCLKLTRDAGARLIINDRVDVAMAAGADGVHLGQDDLPVDHARAILGRDKIIGLSTHTLAQFRAGMLTSADYLALGPIYQTTSKENPDPAVGLELLKEARRIADRPVVAIGGITIERARDVIAAGADSVAVISALYPSSAFAGDETEAGIGSEIAGRTRSFISALAG